MGPVVPRGSRRPPPHRAVLAYGPARREGSLRRADAVHGGLVGAEWPPRYATMIGASTKYLVIGSAMASFARGFDDDGGDPPNDFLELGGVSRSPDGRERYRRVFSVQSGDYSMCQTAGPGAGPEQLCEGG